MSNQVYINPHGIIEIEVVGDQTAGSVHEMGAQIENLITKVRSRSQPVLLLDNLKHLGSTTPEARREVARLAKSLDFDRTAMLGQPNSMMRYGTNLMLRAIGKSNIRYFANRDAALLWLGVSPK